MHEQLFHSFVWEHRMLQVCPSLLLMTDAIHSVNAFYTNGSDGSDTSIDWTTFCQSDASTHPSRRTVLHGDLFFPSLNWSHSCVWHAEQHAASVVDLCVHSPSRSARRNEFHQNPSSFSMESDSITGDLRRSYPRGDWLDLSLFGSSARENGFVVSTLTLPASETSAPALRSIRTTVNRSFTKIEAPVLLCAQRIRRSRISKSTIVWQLETPATRNLHVQLLAWFSHSIQHALRLWPVGTCDQWFRCFFTSTKLALKLLPLTSISFYAGVPWNLKLMTRTVKYVCPRWRRVPFKIIFQFHDDLNEETPLTLSTFL